MLAQGRCHDAGQRDRSAASGGLRFPEPRLFPGAFQRLAYRQRAGIQIHGIPRQTERLTEPQAKSDGYGKQGFEPMTSDGGKELPGLLGCQRRNLARTIPWRIGQGRDVARDDLPLQSLIQRRAKNCPCVVNRAAADSRRMTRLEPRAHVQGSELGEPHAADPRFQMNAHHLLVALVRTGPDLATDNLKPTPEESTHRLLFGDWR